MNFISQARSLTDIVLEDAKAYFEKRINEENVNDFGNKKEMTNQELMAAVDRIEYLRVQIKIMALQIDELQKQIIQAEPTIYDSYIESDHPPEKI